MDPSGNPDGGYTPTAVDRLCPVEECTLKVDIHVESGDSVKLGAHIRNLAFFEFPSLPEGANGEGGVIRLELEEEAEVLKCLLKFMHNTRQPNLGVIPFSQLFAVAEAAEKYLVHSAMESCKTQMERYVHQDPIGVWIYAVKHNYPTLANTTATSTMDFLPTEVLLRAQDHKMKEASIMQWHRFREQWYLVFRLVLKRETSCADWERFQFNVIMDVGDRLTTLVHFNKIAARHQHFLEPNCCSRSGGFGLFERQNGISRYFRWLSSISEKIAGLKLYSDCVEV